MLILSWGSQIMLGVVEEKSNRVVEVTLSRISARDLLVGKVAGIGFLALLQFAIVTCGIGLSLWWRSQQISIPGALWSALPVGLACFFFGFAFYGSSFAAVGSTAARVEDTQSAQLPALMPLMITYGLLSVQIGQGDNMLLAIMTYIPWSAPIALPVRAAITSLSWWQIVLPLVVLVASTAAMFRFAGWIYMRSLLHVGSRIRLSQLWRSRRSNELLVDN